MPYLGWLSVPDAVDGMGYPYLAFRAHVWCYDEAVDYYYNYGMLDYTLACHEYTGILAPYQGRGMTVNANGLLLIWANGTPPVYAVAPVGIEGYWQYYSGVVLQPREIGGWGEMILNDYQGYGLYQSGSVFSVGVAIGINSSTVTVYKQEVYPPITFGPILGTKYPVLP